MKLVLVHFIPTGFGFMYKMVEPLEAKSIDDAFEQFFAGTTEAMRKTFAEQTFSVGGKVFFLPDFLDKNNDVVRPEILTFEDWYDKYL